MARIRAATETIAGLTHRIAALRDVVTVEYPAGNRTTVPMVNFRASARGTETDGVAGSGSDAVQGGGTTGSGPDGAPEGGADRPESGGQIPRVG